MASVFMGLFVYNAALIGVFKNRWKVMFGKWSIIMPEFLLRVPRWSQAGASDLGPSIVGINYNPIITSIVWTVSCELLQLCSQPFLSMFNPLAVKRSMVGFCLVHKKYFFNVSLRQVNPFSHSWSRHSEYFYTCFIFTNIYAEPCTHRHRNSGTRWHTNMNRNSCKVCEIILRVYESFLQICVCCLRGHMNIKCTMGSEHEIK